MPIYDQNGNRISDGVPSRETIKKEHDELRKSGDAGIPGHRDSSRYGGFGGNFHVLHPTEIGRISFQLLRHVYASSSAVRPAVDGITRQVAHLPWDIFHKDMKYHPPSQSADIREFFEFPNSDNEDLSTVLAKYISDMLIIGKGAIEKVRNINGKIVELVARDAATIRPKIDKFGNTIAYEEIRRASNVVIAVHDKKNFIYRQFTPNSYTLGTIPIIETIINEVALLMLSVKSIGWAFTRGEIPPGMLHLGDIGDEALRRAQASFEAASGLQGESKIRVVDNVDQVQWVQFTRPFREMQVAELMPIIERIVARNFGLSSVESSLSDVAARSADVSIKQSNSRLIVPMSTIIAFDMNTVVREFDPTQKFKFVSGPNEQFKEKTGGLIALWRSGIFTTNEVRSDLGRSPVKGGDQRTVLLGNEVVPIDESGKPIKVPAPQPPPGEARPNPFNPPGRQASDTVPPDTKPSGTQSPKRDEQQTKSVMPDIEKITQLDEDLNELFGDDVVDNIFDLPEDEQEDLEWK